MACSRDESDVTAAHFPSKILRHGEPSAATVRVLTFNILARHAEWNQRRRVLVDGLRALAPDLIAFQETVCIGGYDQTADLLAAGYHIVNSKARSADGVGCSVATRWPSRHERELDMHVSPRTAGFPCTTMLVEIDVPDPIGRVLFVNHFPSYQVDYEYERELQTVIAARAIEAQVAQDPMHVVLAGDLDAEPDAASIRFLTGKQSLDGMSVCYRSAWDSVHPGESAGTFSPENPLSPASDWDWPFHRIDHILVRHGTHGGPSLRVLRCERAFDVPIDGVWASDHFGLVADLTSPESRAAVP
jgi:endonuclease/exonuclease/phosphatase family metal-dependent hydrolase